MVNSSITFCERSCVFVNVLWHTQVEDSITMVCERSCVFVNVLWHTQVEDSITMVCKRSCVLVNVLWHTGGGQYYNGLWTILRVCERFVTHTGGGQYYNGLWMILHVCERFVTNLQLLSSWNKSSFATLGHFCSRTDEPSPSIPLFEHWKRQHNQREAGYTFTPLLQVLGIPSVILCYHIQAG